MIIQKKTPTSHHTPTTLKISSSVPISHAYERMLLFQLAWMVHYILLCVYHWLTALYQPYGILHVQTTLPGAILWVLSRSSIFPTVHPTIYPQL